MKFETDLTTERAWSVAALPEGTYPCVIDDAKLGTSTGGHEQIEMSWTVLDGPHRGAEQRDNLVVLRSTYGKVCQLLDAIGVARPGGGEELDVSKLIGRRAKLMIRNERGRDDPTKMFPKPAGYLPYKGEPAGAPNGAGTTGDENLPF